MTGRSRVSLLGLCSLMGGSGILHLLVPQPYRRIVPIPLRRYAGPIVAVSGLCELACVACMLVPRMRRIGAFGTAALLVAVFPANVQMALDSRGSRFAALAWLRLPMQVPLILWALSVKPRDIGGISMPSDGER